MSKSKNWKNGENTGNFSKIEKKQPKIWVLGNDIINVAHLNSVGGSLHALSRSLRSLLSPSLPALGKSSSSPTPAVNRTRVEDWPSSSEELLSCSEPAQIKNKNSTLEYFCKKNRVFYQRKN